jgi:hypothetical protein
MAEQREQNYHFKQLTAGMPGEVMAQLGEALLAVERLRAKDKVDAAALLRKAWLALARQLVRTRGAELNPQQQLFLQSGALGDTVVLRNAAGERVGVELLPSAMYEALLAAYCAPPTGVPGSILTPLRRMSALAQAQFGPFDLNKPGRYREPQAQAAPTVNRGELAAKVGEVRDELENARAGLAAGLKDFLGLLSNDRLAPVLQAVGGLLHEAQQFLQSSRQLDSLAGLSVPETASHPSVAIVEQLVQQLDAGGNRVRQDQAKVLQLMARLAAYHRALDGTAGAAGAAAEQAGDAPLVLEESAARVVERDLESINGVVVQTLNNAPGRTHWSPGRVLVAELFERFENPVEDCCATPGNLAASLRKADALHPNCFPHDGAGQLLLPPVYVVPGVDIVKWYDDRFVVSFVHTEPARAGAKLRLSPVDLAALRIFGQFTARGELYDYRGDRLTGNFIADYAGEVKSKAAVKFTGDSKKMTYVTSTEVGDAAGRDEAVEDYLDFIHLTANSLPLPKRVTPRRVGVILDYCTIVDADHTAALALKHVMAHDSMQVRKIILRLAGNNPRRIVAMLQQALDTDPQVASRFRRQLEVAIKEVMGQEFYVDARAQGLFGTAPASASAPADGGVEGEPAPPGGHDYFDV